MINTATPHTFSVEAVRKQFPILQREVKGKPLVYLDNAATTQKPQQVIDAITHYYSHYNANVHRGIHTLSEEGTLAMEASRDYIANFIGAKREEVVFTKGTTDGINLVANSLGQYYFNEGDEIIITTMEHHANIVPWQMLVDRIGVKLRIAPIHEDGSLNWDGFEALLNEKTKLVAMVHISNSLGTINPVEKVINTAHQRNIPVLLDAAQSIAHTPVDVQKLDVDFLVFSGHKAFGPTGIGVLYGKKHWLQEMPPYQGGGEMILEVRFEKTTYNELPFKFEAGTPNIAGAIVIAEGLKFIESLGFDAIAAHEQELIDDCTKALLAIDGLKIIGTAKEKAAVASFVVDGVHHQDLALMLDTKGIAVRTGHHCTQPLMHSYGIEGTTRASFSVYNTVEEVAFFTESLERTVNLLKA